MGNFYANVVVPNADVERVATLVDGLRRRALIATAGGSTFIYDAKCDEQDLAAIEELTRAVSHSCGTALGVCNHDDDLLWYALARDGRVIDVYNSDPGLFDGEELAPSGGDAALITSAFGVPEARERVHALLHDGRRGAAVEQHAGLCAALGIPEGPAILGYRYVSQGELDARSGGNDLRAVGGADLPPVPVFPATAQRPKASAAPSAPAPGMVPDPSSPIGVTLALARADVSLDERFAHVVGKGPMNGFLAMMKVKQYVTENKLRMAGDGTRVHCDALLADLLGVKEYVRNELPTVALQAFGLPLLTPEEMRAAVDPESPLAKELNSRRLAATEAYAHWMVERRFGK